MVDIRAIPDHPGYFASAEGDIYSGVRRGRLPESERIGGPLRKLAPGIGRVRNYERLQVVLGRHRTRKVARLVLLAFTGHPPTPDHQVAHLNGNSLDNRAVNLAWKTKEENEADKIEHGTTNRGTRQGASKLTEDDVRAIREAFRSGEYQKDIGARYGVSQGHISMICNRIQWAWLD